jgi:hypothetical protein
MGEDVDQDTLTCILLAVMAHKPGRGLQSCLLLLLLQVMDEDVDQETLTRILLAVIAHPAKQSTAVHRPLSLIILDVAAAAAAGDGRGR